MKLSPSGRRLILLAAVLSATSALTAQAATATPDPLPAVKLDRWRVLGPIPISEEKAPAPDLEAQKKPFDADLLATCGGESRIRPTPPPPCTIGGRALAWKAVETVDGMVDLAKAVGKTDYALAYALADVPSPTARTVFLGIGSDDAVKVWLNGKLVHTNWVLRGLRKDQDLVPVDLQAGRNQLLLKIHNATGDWSFAARSMDTAGLQEALWTAAKAGDVDKIQLILGRVQGVEVDAKTKLGLTAWQIAKISGRSEAADLLASKGADTHAPQPAPAEIVDAMLSGPTRGQTPGAAVLVSKDGKILFEKGYGYASLEHRVRVTPATKFRIGSITKQFTASAILRLQEQGKLSVEDPLTKYIPDYPRGGEVTLRHLLTHTSGIHSYTDKPDFIETVTIPIKSTEDFIHSFEKDPFDFSPGEKWSYSNSGYFLLGHIVEKVSGQTYADFLRAQFFEPLGMKDTGVYKNGVILADDATGYAQNGATVEKARDWDMSRAGAAGAIYSTVEDLARWNDAVFGGKVLSAASAAEAWTAVKTKAAPEPPDDGYGFGWAVGKFRGLREIQHGGGLNGFLTHLTRFPDQQLTIVVLANALPPVPGLVPPAIAHDVAEVYLSDVMQPIVVPKVMTLTPAELDAFVGRYDYGQAVLTVTREGDHLFAQLSGQPRLEIFPKSANEFFWKVVDAQVTFVKDASGRVTKAHHRQGPGSIDAPRLEEQTAITLDAAALDAFVGKYDFKGQATLTVTREGSQLFAQLTGQPRFEIYPKSPTEFFWKVVNAQIAFVKDGTGKVTKGLFEQSGQKAEVPKIE